MMRRPLLLAVCGLVAVSGGARGAVQSPGADIILINGNIITVDAVFSRVEAAAIRAGRFIAVGRSADVRKHGGRRTALIDLRGRTVVPGLADNHLHGAGGGPGVDLSRARSLAEVTAAIAHRVTQAAPGQIVVTNRDWHEGQLKEQRLPLRRDLDAVSPRTPVVVVRGGHEYILNSAALQRWKIDERTPEPPGGRISRYADGTLNGELVDRAKNLVPLDEIVPPLLSPRTRDARITDKVAEYDRLHAAGLTSVRHPGISLEEYRLLLEMKQRGLLTMRVRVLLTPTALSGLQQGEGDEWLRIDGVKLGVDGGFEGGWMREAYEEPYGEGGTYRGLQTLPLDSFTAQVRALHRDGWRVFTHAVGDAAIDQVLTAYEAADADKPISGQRWGIEHAFIARPDHLPRMTRLGLAVAAQHHLYLAAPSLVKYWGAARAARTTPMRMFIDAGLPVSSGTDAPVVPYPPLWTIYHFVTRGTISAGVLDAGQGITRAEALRASTMGNAWLGFEEDARGSIEVGKAADLVVLSDDIMTCPEKRIEQMDVLLTMVGGRVVYRDPAISMASVR
ncbi:MAG: amidohydrolase [Vicinamibacterales bacterium]